MARSMFSLGMFSFLPAKMAERSRGLESGSPPPTRAAMVISRITLVKARPRLASVAAFLCLMVAHLECPDMRLPLVRPQEICLAAALRRHSPGRPLPSPGQFNTAYPAAEPWVVGQWDTDAK